jgi:hypothetical protein
MNNEYAWKLEYPKTNNKTADRGLLQFIKPKN